jgi:hypothetical protein
MFAAKSLLASFHRCSWRNCSALGALPASVWVFCFCLCLCQLILPWSSSKQRVPVVRGGLTPHQFPSLLRCICDLLACMGALFLNPGCYQVINHHFKMCSGSLSLCLRTLILLREEGLRRAPSRSLSRAKILTELLKGVTCDWASRSPSWRLLGEAAAASKPTKTFPDRNECSRNHDAIPLSA